MSKIFRLADRHRMADNRREMPTTFDLTELLDTDDIHLQFQSATLIEAIPRLLRPALMRRLANETLVEAIIGAVVARENEATTRCGPLALPHARHAALDEFVLSLAANGDGVISGQKEPRLIFAFVSPEGKREQHLQLLASLARISQNRRVVEQISGASSADQVIDGLRSVGI
jgi:mannitol/fructose-specific phosphotransferase system IIA component (Ntr-type)